MHEVIGKDERLTQAVGILIAETLAVEVGISGVHDAVVQPTAGREVPGFGGTASGAPDDVVESGLVGAAGYARRASVDPHRRQSAIR